MMGLAAALRSGAIIDEFVTALPRAMRLEVAAAVGAFIRARGFRGVVLASCHGRPRRIATATAAITTHSCAVLNANP
jgi:hypothetical protein